MATSKYDHLPKMVAAGDSPRSSTVLIKILSGLLVLSVLFNIAGLVFFICFLKVNGSYKNIKKENQVMAQNLTAVRAATVIGDAVESGQVTRHPFESIVDGKQDWYALSPPAPGRLDNTLLVYLHGMGSNCLEPFACPKDRTIAQGIATRYSEVCLLSLPYRDQASWGNDLAMSDITQNIRAVLQKFPFKRIVLMGTSMGGCTVLTYATQAPADIKSMIAGIVSVEGAGDLSELYDSTENSTVKAALLQVMGGTPKQAAFEFKRKSFIPHSQDLPPGVRVAVVSAQSDQIVPPVLQQEIVDVLTRQNTKVKMIPVDGGHGAPPAKFYVQGLDFALGSR